MCVCTCVQGGGRGANGGTTKANQSFRIKINPNLAQVVKSRGRVEPRGLRSSKRRRRREDRRMVEEREQIKGSETRHQETLP